MPLGSGWVAYPVSVASEGLLSVELSATQSGRSDAPRLTMAFVVAPTYGFTGSSVGGQEWRWLEANAEGAGVACCGGVPGTPFVPGTTATTTYGPSELYVLPNETVWVGVLASHWEAGDAFEARLSATNGTAAPVAVVVGEARSGTDVWMADLVELAHRDGVNVRAFGQTLAGSAGEATAMLAPQGKSLVLLDYAAWGEATARVVVEHAGQVALDARPREAFGGLSMIRAGPVRVTLSDVEVPPGGPFLAHGVSASVLVADIDLPVDHFLAYEDAIEW